jgi:UDP-N-acetyl-D-glucosamine dehydrogenase
MPFYPGPGLGGHCIPIDPFYLSWRARQFGMEAQFVELAGRINTGMPEHVVDRLEALLSERGVALADARVLVLGAAYKADVGDPRESPGIMLMEILRARGATIAYSDPHVPALPTQRKHDLGLQSIAITPEVLRDYDAALIATAHGAYDYELLADHANLVLDTRNAMKNVADARGVVHKA